MTHSRRRFRRLRHPATVFRIVEPFHQQAAKGLNNGPGWNLDSTIAPRPAPAAIASGADVINRPPLSAGVALSLVAALWDAPKT